MVYDFGRPDIEISINTKDIKILIECKIDHFERPNQLSDYQKILNQQDAKNKHLVYLTKYYDFKDLNHKDISFHQNKWADIYSLIGTNNQQVTLQLKKYIKEQGMADSSNFHYHDLATLENISSTVRKMDEVLDSIKNYFEQNIGGLSKDSSRSTRIKNSWYVNYHSVHQEKIYKYEISIGFFWWDEEISLALRIYIPKKNKDSKYFKNVFEKNLKEWESEEWEDAYNHWYYKTVAQFIIDEKEQIPEMIKFLKEGIEELSELKEIDSSIFG